MSEAVVVEKLGVVTRLWLNRPEAFNALNLEMAEELAQQLTALASDKRVRAVIVSGRGRAFCAGGDLKWALAFPQGPAAAFRTLAGRFHLAVTEIRRMEKPVIAAINGVAAGGGFSLALACDFRVMSEEAILRQAYTSAGLSIDGGGTFTLPRLVGLARALEIAAFDEPINAEKAKSWGLAGNVVKDEKVQEEAVRIGELLARRSANSFAWSKKLLNDSFETGFETQIERERGGLAACAEHPDGQEGLRAFVEKRSPRFGGQ